METNDTATKEGNESLFQELMDQCFADAAVVPDPQAFAAKLAAKLTERRAATMVKHALGALDPTPHTNHIEGIGQPMMEIDMDEYLFWETKLPGCWFDDEFRREYRRDCPAARTIYQRYNPLIMVA